MSDFDEVVTQLAEETKQYIEERLSKIEARHALEIAALKSVEPLQGEPGKDGDPGKDAEIDYGRVAEIVKSIVFPMFDALPKPKDGEPGKPGEPGKNAEVDYDKVGDIISLAVSKAVAQIPPAKDGERGKDAEPIHPDTVRLMIVEEVGKAVSVLPKAKDGESVDQEAVRSYVRDVVAASVAQIPRPENGKDAEVDYDRIVGSVVAKIPVPQNGKDAEPVDYERIIKSVVEQIPTPVNGKDAEVDYTKVTQGVSDLIKQQIAELPKPKDGNSVTLADVAPLIEGAVAAAVGALPRPKDGNSITVDDVRPMLETMVAEIPRPQDGKSVDPVEVSAMIDEKLSKAVAALPPPREPRDFDPAEMLSAVKETVAKTFAEIPKPKDGEPGKDALASAVLRGIDEGRSYPPNTYASHRGAFMVSERQTSPVGPDGLKAAGWFIVADGVALQDIEQDASDPRVFKIKQVLASGTSVEKTYSVPSVIDRGVWHEGMKCGPGDLVTCKGAGWISRRENESRPGTVPEDWRLTYKSS